MEHTAVTQPEQPWTKPRRRRAQCRVCRTPIYVAIGTPDEQRATCRYCLHAGFGPITGFSQSQTQTQDKETQ